MRRIGGWIATAAFALGVSAMGAETPGPLLARAGSLPPMKTALVFGQKIFYYEAGAGPTLVLVHGFGSQAIFDWGQVIPALAKQHHVLAMDQVGFGQSDKPFIDYSVQTYVDFLGEFLRTLKVEHFDLAGESLGGWIVASYTIQALAAENTGKYALPKPERLILEDAAGHVDPFHREGAASSNGKIPISGDLKDAAGVAIVFHDKTRVTEEFVRENFALKLKSNDGMTERLLAASPKLKDEVVAGKLGAITIPTLVVWGENDELIPLADGKDYAAKIKGARLVVVPECGHGPSIEKPKEFLDAVETFLKAR